MPPTQFKPSEIATLLVNGQEYKDWETIWAQERWNESFSFFRFTTAEREPIPNVWEDLPVAPCDGCQILFGGEPAIKGYVTQRQVAYDADRHQVLLIGKSATFWPFKSHIDTKEANMDGLNIVQIANKLINPYGVKVRVVGSVDTKVFEKEQASPGQNIWEYLDKLARQRAALLGSDAAGQVLLIGDHEWGDPVDVLMDGVNIKRMQATISIEDQWGEIDVLGQTSGGDDQNGSDANDMRGQANGGSCVSCKLVIPVEEPVKTQAELYQRAYFEAKWTDGTKITALITVQGWFTRSGQLWHAGQNVSVFAPLVPIEQVLKIKTCTWTQDSENGTETVLECVNPWALNDDTQVNVGNPTAQPPPDKPAQVPATPPATPVPPTTPGAPASGSGRGGGRGGGF
jgi:prophage tail gpP-like protein